MVNLAELPRKILVEKGAIKKIAEIASVFGSKFLVVVDPFTKNLGGENIAKSVKGKIFTIENSTMQDVKKAEDKEIDCIISFGGGKPIDVGKLAAHNMNIPFISFPTACSHDGIASKNASIIVDGEFKSFAATTPAAVVADLDIILKSPYRLTASGAADVLSNYCAVADWRLASENGEEEYSEAVAGLSIMAADLVSSNSAKIKNLEAEGLKNLVWSLIFSGMSMSLHGSSRPASGAEHMFSHSLDRIGKFGLHGEQVGIGTVFFSYLHGLDFNRIKKTLEEIGAPTTIKQINLPQEAFVDAVLKAKDVRKRYTILDEKEMTKELILKVAGEAGII